MLDVHERHGVSSVWCGYAACEQLVAQRGVVAQLRRPAPRSAPRPSPARRRGRRARARSRRPARRAGSSGPRRFSSPTCSSRFSTTSGASPSDGSSSSSSSGLPISVRAIVSICCSPPDRKPPCRSRSSSSLGNSSHTASIVQRPGRPAARRATSRFSQHGQLGEDAPVLRHEADAERAPSGTARQPVIVLPLPQRSRPGVGGVSPMIERMVVVLPTPLRPSRQTHSPASISSETPNSTRALP